LTTTQTTIITALGPGGRAQQFFFNDVLWDGGSEDESYPAGNDLIFDLHDERFVSTCQFVIKFLKIFLLILEERMCRSHRPCQPTKMKLQK